MSAPLHFYGRMDRRDQALNLNAAQVGRELYQRMYGLKRANNAYAPPTRGVSGNMPKN